MKPVTLRINQSINLFKERALRLIIALYRYKRFFSTNIGSIVFFVIGTKKIITMKNYTSIIVGELSGQPSISVDFI